MTLKYLRFQFAKNWTLLLFTLQVSFLLSAAQDVGVDSLSTTHTAPSSDSVFTIVFDEESTLTRSFVDQIPFAISLNQSSVEPDYSQFQLKLPDRVPAIGYSVWHKFKLVNNGQQSLALYVFISRHADSCHVWTKHPNGAVERSLIGNSINPVDKDLPTGYNLMRVELAPKSWKEYTLQTKYNANASPRHFTTVFTGEAHKYQNKLIFKYSTQSFYFGVLMLFCLVSIFMYFSFKDRVFILFGLLMVSFALYFLNYHGLFALMLYDPFLESPRFSLNNVFAVCIVLSLTWFVKSYIQLKERLATWHTILVSSSIIVSMFSIVGRGAGVDPYLVARIFNSSLIIWTIIVMTPISILVRRGHGSARVALIAIFVLFVSSVLFILRMMGLAPDNFLTADSIQIGVLVFSGLLFYGLFEKISVMKSDRLRMAVEKQKSDELLYNMLPAEIAHELKAKGKADARDFDQVSILFTDFKGFTEQSAKMSATDLVKEINTCFEAFDGIVAKYNIEKIKTIGDSYMAAGGLPLPTDDSAKNTVLAALEMQDFIVARHRSAVATDQSAFQMRVGIHTGPVVAGIVGVKKYQYDIWGDTVNTASRMESSGEVGKVNISQVTYERLKDDPEFVFISRGKVEAKGKGAMEMYFVALSKTMKSLNSTGSNADTQGK